MQDAKMLGGIGSILVLLTAVPGVGVVVGVVGFVLILVAIKYVSDATGDRSIYDNMLIGVIMAIAGLVLGAAVIVISVVRFFGLNLSNLSSISTKFNSNSYTTGQWMGLAGELLVGLVVVWLALSFSAVFVRRTYTSIGTKLNISMFQTAGTVYLIGAVTTLVLVGFIILFVAQILLVVAFFSVDEKAHPPPVPQAP